MIKNLHDVLLTVDLLDQAINPLMNQMKNTIKIIKVKDNLLIVLETTQHYSEEQAKMAKY